MSSPLLSLNNDLIGVVCQRLPLPSLCALMDTNQRMRHVATKELSRRLQQWGIDMGRGWDHAQVRDTYLWHFGRPRTVCQLHIDSNWLAVPFAQGFACLQEQRLGFHPFPTDEQLGDPIRSWEAAEREMPVRATDLALFQAKALKTPIALIQRPQVRLIAMDGTWDKEFGPAHAATIDSAQEAHQLALLQRDGNNWIMRWCTLADLDSWQSIQIPADDIPLLDNSQLILDWREHHIEVLRRDWPEQPNLRQMGHVDPTTLTWEKHPNPPRDWYVPLRHSPWHGKLPAQPKMGSTVQLASIGLGAIEHGTLNLMSSRTHGDIEMDVSPVRFNRNCFTGPGTVQLRPFRFERDPLLHSLSLFPFRIGSSPALCATWSDGNTPPSKCALRIWKLTRPPWKIGKSDWDEWGESPLYLAIRSHQPWSVISELGSLNQSLLKGLAPSVIHSHRPHLLKHMLKLGLEADQPYCSACRVGALEAAKILLNKCETLPDADLFSDDGDERWVGAAVLWGPLHGILYAADFEQWHIVPELVGLVCDKFPGVDPLLLHRAAVSFALRGDVAEGGAEAIGALAQQEKGLLETLELACAAGRYGLFDLLEAMRGPNLVDIDKHVWVEPFDGASISMQVLGDLLHRDELETYTKYAQWVLAQVDDPALENSFKDWLPKGVAVDIDSLARIEKKPRKGLSPDL